jgi:hypothetical protein
MTATNKQIIEEAHRRWGAAPIERKHSLSDYVIEIMRESWTPPEPVDPDVLAFREWAAAQGVNFGFGGLVDAAYLAGARMAREQEQERAKVLVEYVETDARPGSLTAHPAAVAARAALAAYKAGKAAR